MVYRTAPFSMTLNDPYPRFLGHAILWRWVSQKRYEIHSFSEILIAQYNKDYTCPTQLCHFEWSWVTRVTSSDLAKYSMTPSVARSLCDSWVSCSLSMYFPACLLVCLSVSFYFILPSWWNKRIILICKEANRPIWTSAMKNYRQLRY